MRYQQTARSRPRLCGGDSCVKLEMDFVVLAEFKILSSGCLFQHNFKLSKRALGLHVTNVTFLSSHVSKFCHLILSAFDAVHAFQCCHAVLDCLTIASCLQHLLVF